MAIYKGNIPTGASWTVQAGSSFGTTEDGEDWLVVPYEGRADQAQEFQKQWEPKVSAPPFIAFGHLKMQSVDGGRIGEGGLAQASVRFAGITNNAGSDPDPAIGTDPVFSYSAQRQQVSVKIPWEENAYATYSYDANVVTASYHAAALPTNWGTNLHANGELGKMGNPAFIRLEYVTSGVEAPAPIAAQALAQYKDIHGYVRVDGKAGDYHLMESSTRIFEAAL